MNIFFIFNITLWPIHRASKWAIRTNANIRLGSNEMSYDASTRICYQIGSSFEWIVCVRSSRAFPLSHLSALINIHSQLIKTKQPAQRFHRKILTSPFFSRPFTAWPDSMFTMREFFSAFCWLPKYRVVPGTIAKNAQKHRSSSKKKKRRRGMNGREKNEPRNMTIATIYMCKENDQERAETCAHNFQRSEI